MKQDYLERNYVQGYLLADTIRGEGHLKMSGCFYELDPPDGDYVFKIDLLNDWIAGLEEELKKAYQRLPLLQKQKIVNKMKKKEKIK